MEAAHGSISFLIKSQANKLFSQFESWGRCIRNTAHQTRTKRFPSFPVDLLMVRAHSSKLDRLRLCEGTASDLTSFHLQNPSFLCLKLVCKMFVCVGAHMSKHVHYSAVILFVQIYECMCVNKQMPTLLAIMAE